MVEWCGLKQQGATFDLLVFLCDRKNSKQINVTTDGNDLEKLDFIIVPLVRFITLISAFSPHN